VKRAVVVVPVLVLGVFVVLLFEARTNSARDSSAPGTTPPANTAPASSTPIALDGPLVVDESDTSESQIEPVTTGPPTPIDARRATVRFISDGDSFDITWSDTSERDEVRLIGINAPEGDACFGNRARSVLRSLIEDQTVDIQVSYRDEFGRILGDVWVDDLYVNAMMIEVGGAVALTDASDHADALAAAQIRAQDATRGLWDPQLCGSDPELRVVIVDINADADGRDDENPNGEWIDILNDGEDVVDLSGWSIRDESTRHRFLFPTSFLLAPNERVRVFSGCGDDSTFDLYWCDGNPVWNNAGDTGFLVDAEGLFVDTFDYGS